MQSALNKYHFDYEDIGYDDYLEIEYLNRSYQEKPFNVLNQAIYMQGIDSKELFDYFKSDMSKPKYENLDMDDGFNELFTNLSAMVGSSDFIAAS
ncbi:MAG: hypothetical protein LBU89_01845 [Fibromonadaceae bacterium]|nr:hypothetical protein [Fibromonadaceae bacterium]